jgi:hypothetical protein
LTIPSEEFSKGEAPTTFDTPLHYKFFRGLLVLSDIFKQNLPDVASNVTINTETFSRKFPITRLRGNLIIVPLT